MDVIGTMLVLTGMIAVPMLVIGTTITAVNAIKYCIYCKKHYNHKW